MTGLEEQRRPTPFETHHWYWGVLIGTGGFVLLFWHPIPGTIVGGLGLWIAGDDLVQHLIQHWNPGYLSPWHLWFYALLGWAVDHTSPGSRVGRFLQWVAHQ